MFSSHSGCITLTLTGAITPVAAVITAGAASFKIVNFFTFVDYSPLVGFFSPCFFKKKNIPR